MSGGQGISNLVPNDGNCPVSHHHVFSDAQNLYEKYLTDVAREYGCEIYSWMQVTRVYEELTRHGGIPVDKQKEILATYNTFRLARNLYTAQMDSGGSGPLPAVEVPQESEESKAAKPAKKQREPKVTNTAPKQREAKPANAAPAGTAKRKRGRPVGTTSGPQGIEDGDKHAQKKLKVAETRAIQAVGRDSRAVSRNASRAASRAVSLAPSRAPSPPPLKSAMRGASGPRTVPGTGRLRMSDRKQVREFVLDDSEPVLDFWEAHGHRSPEYPFSKKKLPDNGSPGSEDPRPPTKDAGLSKTPKQRAPTKDAGQSKTPKQRPAPKDAGQSKSSEQRPAPKDAGQSKSSEQRPAPKDAGQSKSSELRPAPKDAGQSKSSELRPPSKEAKQTLNILHAVSRVLKALEDSDGFKKADRFKVKISDVPKKSDVPTNDEVERRVSKRADRFAYNYTDIPLVLSSGEKEYLPAAVACVSFTGNSGIIKGTSAKKQPVERGASAKKQPVERGASANKQPVEHGTSAKRKRVESGASAKKQPVSDEEEEEDDEDSDDVYADEEEDDVDADEEEDDVDADEEEDSEDSDYDL